MPSNKSVFFLIPALLFCCITAIIVCKNRVDTFVPVLQSSISQEPILIIDAGHGGLDGGAVSVYGQKESEINLSVAKKLREVCRLFGIEPEMTRKSENLDYPPEAGTVHEKKVWDQKSRVALINSVENAVLICIHQNNYPDSRPSGIQVFYGKAEGSDVLAGITQDNLISNLCPECRRVAAPISEKIYLMHNIRCPAILAECGFLSNPADAEKLSGDSYRTELAVILCASYLQYVC